MWGREIEPHTVLYLSLEDTFNRLQKRLLQLVGSEEAPERLVMQTECSSIGQGLEEQLTSFLYQHPDTGLIVIDTLQKVRSNDQNNSMYASDYKEISALKALADKYNVCILLIHHLRKQAADDPFQQIAGSNGLMGASDTSWVMQRKRMSQTADILRSHIRVGCTGCRYCMPCPMGVDIPDNFSIWNKLSMFGQKDAIKKQWAAHFPDAEKASHCARCGKCEGVCPQKLPIRASLAQLQQELDTL